MTALQPIYPTNTQLADLKTEFEQAVQELHEAEALLAQEQAHVNAFRMHCRLRLDDVVDELLELHSYKQRLLTHLTLRQQAQEMGVPYEAVDPLHPGPDSEPVDIPPDPALQELLPYHLPQDRAAEKRLYRELARKFHPDLVEGALQKAYSTSMMTAVNRAYAAGDMHALMDLAGELDPAEAAHLQHSSSKEIRQLREKLIKCQKRRRKIALQLQALREEKTAKLWRKAQELEKSGRAGNWWDEIRAELLQARDKLHLECAELQNQFSGPSK